MPNIFASRILHRSNLNHSRVTEMTTPHGVIQTPAFMPVGTRAFVNHMTPEDLHNAGSQIILGGNTYHMLVNPGIEVIRAGGGMHRLMGWDKPMLTDSGGFQVFSLAQQCTLDDQGAHFQHPTNRSKIHLTPRTAIKTQQVVGADIIMALDDCIADHKGRDAVSAALNRTHRWLSEAKMLHTQSPYSVYGYRQALFGIVQGGYFRDLREQSARFITEIDPDGIAIGGVSVDRIMDKTMTIIDWVRPLLPEQKVRYVMGIGLNPQDLIDVVAHGIDIFDCVAPTRNARHGALYHGMWVVNEGWLQFVGTETNGKLLIKKTRYAQDERPILEGCTCYTCKKYSRAYLHFLFKQSAPLYYQLACIHNVFVMHKTCDYLRQLIQDPVAPISSL
jgi:queuine tRNA-ribosyltransferase